MKLFTQAQYDRLLENGRTPDSDHPPIVKLFTPDAACTWLISEIDPEEPDLAFGLCDVGFGCAELGSVSIAEIAALRGKLGLPVERDLNFCGKHPMSVYAEAARIAGRINEDQAKLYQAAAALAEGGQS